MTFTDRRIWKRSTPLIFRKYLEFEILSLLRNGAGKFTLCNKVIYVKQLSSVNNNMKRISFIVIWSILSELCLEFLKELM